MEYRADRDSIDHDPCIENNNDDRRSTFAAEQDRRLRPGEHLSGRLLGHFCSSAVL